jgi:hypothetical protein
MGMKKKGQAVQLFGNAAAGVVYNVDVDGSVYGGAPSGQLLASVSNLATGSHTLTLTVKSSTPGGALYFEGATVTVGTGLTG